MYFNEKQLEFLAAKQPEKLFLGGRGVGKTHVIGAEKYNCLRKFKQGKTFLSSTTYAQILTKTLPEMQSVWLRYGLKEDLHYVIGKRPPSEFLKPFKPVKRYENVLTFGNGYTIEFLSMDRPDLARGGSYDGGDIDEVALVKKEAYTRVILPSVRGNRDKFKHIPEHGQVRMYSSVPWKTSGYWILDYEEMMKQDPDKYFFHEATTLDNIAVLGVEYFERLKRTLPWLEYQIEILNRRIRRVMGGFYHKFNPEIHCRIDTYDYGLNAGGIYVKGDKKDVVSKDFIDFTVDLGGRFNCGLAIQTRRNQMNVLKEFFVKDNRKLKELVEDFCAHFEDHQNKYVRLFGEPRGNDRQPDGAPLFTRMKQYFEAEDWECEICATPTAEDHATRYNLMTVIFEESDPNFPTVRINENKCKNFILVLQTTEVKDDMKKDKAKERDQNFPQEQAPHLGDAFDNYTTQMFPDLINSDGSFYMPNQALIQ